MYLTGHARTAAAIGLVCWHQGLMGPSYIADLSAGPLAGAQRLVYLKELCLVWAFCGHLRHPEMVQHQLGDLSPS